MLGEYLVFIFGATASFPIIHWVLNRLSERQIPIRHRTATASNENRHEFISTIQSEAVERVERCIWLVVSEARTHAPAGGATIGGNIRPDSLSRLRSASQLVRALFPVEISNRFQFKLDMVLELPAHLMGDPERVTADTIETLLQFIHAQRPEQQTIKNLVRRSSTLSSKPVANDVADNMLQPAG